MCGICGIINFNEQPVSIEDIKNMMKAMKHRGPDDAGIFTHKNVGLGHVRLSILDLTKAGHQPMFDITGTYCIVHNGEVYNYLELKQLLCPKYTFKSRTDAEVILYAFKEWGVDCLHRFNGMFAFAIYNKKLHSLFIARDRFGIKPLYYYYDGNKFIFASEIKAILKVIRRSLVPNDTAIFDYLVYNRTDHTTETFLKNIKKLNHGHCLYIKIKDKSIKIYRWYKLEDNIYEPFKSYEEFRTTLSSAIKLRLRSDVPVGICLSGGLDSSSILSILLNILHKKDLQTFSVVYGSNFIYDETKYIELFSNTSCKQYKITPTAKSLFNDLHSFIIAQDEPVPSTSPYAQFKVMQLAKDHIKVLLDGQGGDEILAGYHYFLGNYLYELLFTNIIKLIYELLKYYRNYHSLYAIKALIFFMFPHFLKPRAKMLGRNYLRADFYSLQSKISTLGNRLYRATNLRQALIDHFEYKLEHLLRWEDRNSMWFSLEARVPFLDHILVEKTLALPSCYIINHGTTKYILREALKNILPEPIRLRKDKIGFLTPEDKWFRTSLFKEFILDILHSRFYRENPYIDSSKCISLYKLHLEKKINISRDIWKWINLKVWFDNFVYNKLHI